MNKRQRSSTYRPKRRERSRPNNSHRSELEYRPSRDELKFITRLRTDLLEAVAERPDFARFSHTSADTTATILVRFGIETFENFARHGPTKELTLSLMPRRLMVLSP